MGIYMALVVIALVALCAIVACALGHVVGPVILACGFAVFGVMLLGTYQWGPALGAAYLGGSAAELAAAGEYWRSRGPRAKPATGWIAFSTLLGIVGSIVVVLLLYALIAFMAWLSAIS
jgi:hypothetical protein